MAVRSRSGPDRKSRARSASGTRRFTHDVLRSREAAERSVSVLAHDGQRRQRLNVEQMLSNRVEQQVIYA